MSATKDRIVVGLDGSEGARTALSWALAEAAARGADVEVVSVYPLDFYWLDRYAMDHERIEAIRAATEAHASEMVEQVRQEPAVATLPGADAVDVHILVVGGSPTGHLVERSEGAALLVVGSRGRGALRSAVAGSVALHCSAHATCPVVVVHPTTPTAEAAPRGGRPRRLRTGPRRTRCRRRPRHRRRGAGRCRGRLPDP